MPEFSEIGDRIKKCVAIVGGYDSLSEKTGIPVRTLSNYSSGLNDVKAFSLVRIADVAGVSVEWLATGSGQGPEINEKYGTGGGGRGRMLDRHAGPQAWTPGMPQTPVPSPLISVPVINVAASAGGGSIVTDAAVASYIGFDGAWLRAQWNLNPSELFTMPTIGESMEPTVKAGEFLLCSSSEHHRKPGDGIYIVRLEGNVLVKRLQLVPGGKIVISSDNPAYKPYEIMLNDGVDFAILGKVMLVHGLRRV